MKKSAIKDDVNREQYDSNSFLDGANIISWHFHDDAKYFLPSSFRLPFGQ